jgi:cation:H+ antiporter
MLQLVATFLASGAIIVVAGTVLAREADGIAERTGLGRLWVGAVLLAGATSLPELGTDLAAVRLGAVDLAIGDLFGSSMGNMLILALVDLMPPRRGVLRKATLEHGLSASLAIALNAIAAAFFLAPAGAGLLGVAPESLAIGVAYLLGTRAVYRQAVHGLAPDPAASAGVRGLRSLKGLRRHVLVFASAAAALAATTPLFASASSGLATATGLGETFFGTLVVGLSTSLPELVAAVAAVRMGALDLAVGNLFGSNAFNMCLLLPLDIADGPGSIFVRASQLHALTGLFGVVLTSLGLAAILYRAQRRFTMLEPDSTLMVAVYGVALWVLYRHRGGG